MTEFRIENGILKSCWSDEEKVVIPSKVKIVEDCSTFRGASYKELYIHEGIIGIKKNALSGLYNLEKITVHPDNKRYFSRDGVLFERMTEQFAEKITLLCYPCCKKDKEYTIPEDVSYIGECVFLHAKNLNTLIISDNLEASSLHYASDSINEVVVPSCCPFNVFDLSSAKKPRRITVYPSKRRIQPLNFTYFYEKNGFLLTKDSLNGGAVLTTIVRCDDQKNGDVLLPEDSGSFLPGAFDGCDKVTSIIAPDFFRVLHVNDLKIKERPVLPMIFPRVEFRSSKIADMITKYNLLLGCLAHPEYYENSDLGQDYIDYVIHNKGKMLELVYQLDRPDLLKFYAQKKCITKRNFEKIFLSRAQDATAEKCVAFLTEWKNKNL